MGHDTSLEVPGDDSVYNTLTIAPRQTTTQLASYFEYLVEGLFLICWEFSDTRYHLFFIRMPTILIFVQTAIMTLYVKGFKVDKQKVANIVGAPLVHASISAVVDGLNRSAYLSIEGGYEPPGPDGMRGLAFIVALEIGNDKDELKKKDLGGLDETIKKALPHVLVGPDVWELWR
jgi:hypothetical protein